MEIAAVDADHWHPPPLEPVERIPGVLIIIASAGCQDIDPVSSHIADPFAAIARCEWNVDYLLAQVLPVE